MFAKEWHKNADVHLETDSLTLANMINGLVEPTWDTRAIIEEIRCCLGSFHNDKVTMSIGNVIRLLTGQQIFGGLLLMLLYGETFSRRNFWSE